MYKSLKNNVVMTLILAIFMAGSSSLIQVEKLFAAEKPVVQVETKAQKLVNVNQAGSEELQTVRGIGPVIAKRILDYRAEHGKFAKIEDLTSVHGIGQAKFEKIRTQVSV